MSSNALGITVVTPTRGRSELVAKLLRSLRDCAEAAEFDVEVIVVDDSPPAESTAIKALCVDFGADYVSGPRAVGRKRNLGARRARHDLVLFIDSDCVATDSLLRAHWEAHLKAGDNVAAVAGPTRFYGGTTFSARLTERSMVYEAFDAPRTHAQVLWGTTSNLSVRRDVFLAQGGFSERPLTVVGGEDVDLGIRLYEAGYVTSTAPDGLALHARSSGLAVRRSLAKLFTYGRADNWLCQEHGQYVIFHPNPVVLGALGGAVGALVPTRRRGVATAALAALPVVLCAIRELARRRNLKGRADLLDVGAVVLDWSYDLGVAVGAIRAGAPTLTLTRFDYHPQDKFVPHSDDDGATLGHLGQP
ncbi:glycosyltransferase family 2 protein [Micromonospora sp. NPDC051141]|uniref:glycosyltransferase family 2 protein n=1 Tax=Micromonospora sp. NPDC051141 TaxID=3364284 RepID=UPI00379A5BC3